MRVRVYLETKKLRTRYEVSFKFELCDPKVRFAEVISHLQPPFDETIKWLKKNKHPYSYRKLNRFAVAVSPEVAMLIKLRTNL